MWLAVIALALQTKTVEPQAQLARSQIEQSQITQSSARCVAISQTPDERVAPPHQIAPGPPPLLSFRYYEGQLHHRFGNSDLMLDDAGH